MRIERAKQYFAVAFMAGFIGGILFANLTVRDYVTTSGIYNPYFLKQYAQSDIQAGEYILYLCGIRLIPLALIALLGQTRVRRILSIVVFAWAGFSAGTIVCAGILNMGIQGIVFWVIAMVPQFLFYAFAYLIVLWYFFTVPQSRWNLGKTLFVLLFMAAGLITEAYVNPIPYKWNKGCRFVFWILTVMKFRPCGPVLVLPRQTQRSDLQEVRSDIRSFQSVESGERHRQSGCKDR